MKVLRKMPILVMLLMLISSIGFFTLSSPTNIQQASADISGVSGEVINLTGTQGYQPFHYFYDSYGESTLTDISVEGISNGAFKEHKTYINENGVQSSERYVLSGQSETFSSRYASGTSSFILTSEMKGFAQTGNLYVQAVAGVVSLEEDQNDKIKIQLIQDEILEELTSDYVQTQGVANPEWLKTGFYKVNPDDPIEFSFVTAERSTGLNKCKFEIYEPKLIFKIVLEDDGIVFDNSAQFVEPGQVVSNLSATNIVLQKNGTSEYIKYYKSLLNISYEITSGSEYAEIIGKALFINDDAPANAEIKVRAKCSKDSITGEKIYSDEKVFTVKDEEKQIITIKTDFTNPGEFFGQGQFYEGEKVTLFASLKEDYEFQYWTINGEKFERERVYYQVQAENEIYCKIIRKTRVLSISAQDKIYDGTPDAIITTVLEGIESNHDVSLSGLTGVYATKDAGDKKQINLKGFPVLTGADANLYQLETTSIPTGYGNIKPKPIVVSANVATQVYGDPAKTISYTSEGLLDEETLEGSLSRASGNEVGEYDILIGDLAEKNANYDITFNSAKYTITKRPLTLVNILVDDKIYDGTNNASGSAVLGNVVSGDEISLSINMSFEGASAGRQKIVINEYSLIGEKCLNYSFEGISGEYYGTILQKEIFVSAISTQAYYGDEEKTLRFDQSGLIDGEELNGSLVREIGKDVGDYDIQIGDLQTKNPNYKVNFTSGQYKILKRPVTVTALNSEKVYGESEPIKFDFNVENKVSGEEILGSLEREQGENVGEYKILIGNLVENNLNYDITYNEGKFTIAKRPTNIKITILNKVYDKTTKALFTYSFNNVVLGDEVLFTAEFNFEDKNVGENKKVIMKNNLFSGRSVANYQISEINEDLFANITRKDVIISIKESSKVYGDADPAFTYNYSGVLPDETLIGDLSRESGETVGDYEILLNTLNNENNQNYNIVYQNISYLKIIPAPINLKIEDSIKVYGDSDPEFKITLLGSLKFEGETLEEILQGKASREEGEYPGKYKLTQGTLETTGNYYIDEIEFGQLTINKKDITVKAIATTKVYGDADPEFLLESVGVVEGQDVNITLKRAYGEDVGSYTITSSSLSDFRYNITFVSAELTITPREVTIKADKKFKQYGSEEVAFTVSIVDGQLQNDDILENIVSGELVRQAGENVGEYEINKGSISLGKNYIVNYQSDVLEILPAEVEVTAVGASKIYGDEDKALNYKFTKGRLYFSDGIAGSLTRQQGETVGEYDILQGSLSLSKNYNLKFVSAKFIITKRQITVYADATSKTYGEEDPELTFTVDGGLVFGDVLYGSLTREKPVTEQNPLLYETAGKYLISSNLYNDSYDIAFVSEYFTIKQKEVTIKADNKTIYYGQSDPELTYSIISGEILDPLSGGLYRVEGNNVGKYDIRSNLNLGRNYKIKFIKGIFEIKPIDIHISTKNYEKYYGQTNPTFEYEIISGKLLNNEVLLGGITKEEGEEVGVYRLISAFNNTNYNVILTENYITIKPKEAHVRLTIYDKVYNGDTVAYIKNPVVSGLIDEGISLQYNKEDCARFESAEVGNNKKVSVYNLVLTGEKAKNYVLVLPENITGNITHNILSTQNYEAAIETTRSTDLSYGSKLVIIDGKVEVEDVLSSSKQLVKTYNLALEENNKSKEIKEAVKIKFLLPKGFNNRNNYYVYGTNKNGEKVLLSSVRNGKYLEVTTDTLGEFIILTDNERWLDIGSYISIGLIGGLCVWLVVSIIRKKTKKIKKNKNSW